MIASPPASSSNELLLTLVSCVSATSRLVGKIRLILFSVSYQLQALTMNETLPDEVAREREIFEGGMEERSGNHESPYCRGGRGLSWFWLQRGQWTCRGKKEGPFARRLLEVAGEMRPCRLQIQKRRQNGCLAVRCITHTLLQTG